MVWEWWPTFAGLSGRQSSGGSGKKPLRCRVGLHLWDSYIYREVLVPGFGLTYEPNGYACSACGLEVVRKVRL